MTLTVTRAATSLCLVLALTVVRPVTASFRWPTYEMRLACNAACKDFKDIARTCNEDRACDYIIESDPDGDFETYLRCSRPCWALADPCIVPCKAQYQGINATCTDQCADHAQVTVCYPACFQAAFAQTKDSLPLPDGNIGPFVK